MSKKIYSDSEVRGEKVKNSGLLFTEKAKNDYDELNGSQKSFVDQELGEMIHAKNIPQEITLKDLNLNIFLKQDNERTIITRISADGFENGETNREAIKRAKSWNN